MYILKPECSVLELDSSQVSSGFKRWSRGNVKACCRSLSPLSSHLSSQLQVEQGEEEAGGTGGKRMFCSGDFRENLIAPYDGEDDDRLMVFDVEVELGVDLVDDRVDRVGRVGQQ